LGDHLKPVKAAEAELIPELQGQRLVYRSPIVRMRQLFDLYICQRPIKAYPGNPLNYKEGIDLMVFRENTEDLYSGVEFSPVPAELSALLGELSRPFTPLKTCHLKNILSILKSTRDTPRGASSRLPLSLPASRDASA
jgi:isocitrate dehydrogenase